MNDFWTAIIATVIGGLITLIATIVTFVISGQVRLKGVKKAFLKIHEISSYEQIQGKFDFVNTSNCAQVYRDLCFYVYDSRDEISKYIQGEFSILDEEKHYFGEKGYYTVLIESNSVKTIEFQYVTNCIFDKKPIDFKTKSLVLKYFNTKNEEISFKICDFDNMNEVKGKWIEITNTSLKCKQKESENE